MTVGSEVNRDSKFNTITPTIDASGNSERIFLPPINTYHSQLDSRSFLNPGLDMNDAFAAGQNNNEVISDLSHTGNHDDLFDFGPSLRLGPSYAFQRSAAGGQNHYLRQNFETCTSLPSLPYVGSQPVPSSRVNGQLAPYSAHCPSELRGKLASQYFASPPLVAATRSTRGQDSSSYHRQTQVAGSIQQSNSPLGPHSTFDHGIIQTGKGNMTSAQVSRPSTIASVKRAASHPPPLTVQDQRRRKTVPAAPSFIHPSIIPTWTRVTAVPVPNTPRATMTPQASQSFAAPLVPSASIAIPSLVHAAPSVTPQAAAATHSFAAPSLNPNTPIRPSLVQAAQSLITPQAAATHSFAAPSLNPNQIPPFLHAPQAINYFAPSMFHADWSKSALSAPNTTAQSQTIPPVVQTPPLRSVSSSHPSSHAPRPPLVNQQKLIAHSLDQQRLMAAHTIDAHIKYKDETPEAIGHKCFLCKRDLSYSVEGLFSQPLAPPVAAVLPCGHTFHEYCLDRITLADETKDPPCIPCALLE